MLFWPIMTRPQTLVLPSKGCSFAMISTFADLVGPEEEFFSAHFDRFPLLRRRAIEEDSREILSSSHLDTILHREALRSNYLLVVKNGKMSQRHAYTKSMQVRSSGFSDCIDPQKVQQLFRGGSTLVWTGINHFWPNIRAISRLIAEKFSSRADATVFLSPPGGQGFSIHHDPADTYIVQLEGVKHWKVWPTPNIRPTLARNYNADDLGPPALEFALQPGDVLYMPYGTPHVTAAEDKPSLHATFVVEPTMWSNLLLRVVNEVLDSEPAFSWERYLGGSDSGAHLEDFQEKLDRLVEMLRQVDVRAAIKRCTEFSEEIGGVSQDNFFEEYFALSGEGSPNSRNGAP